MTVSIPDPASVAGKAPQPEAHCAVLVIGAGHAGLAAALAAARAGARTMLIDEHPLPAALMGLDVPLHFGQRMNGAVNNRGRMLEQLVASNPGLAAAFELGIDVQLGVHAWGAFVNGPTVRSLQVPLVGLADETRAWFVSFERLIVAAGARDLSLGFHGWEKPGVMGARAAAMLIERYGAFSGRNLLVLGADAPGLTVAETALAHHLAVAGIVDIAAADAAGVERAAPAERARRAQLAARGIPFFFSHVIGSAQGAVEVDAAVLMQVGSEGLPLPGTESTVSCDTIVTALGAVPNIELLDALGCRIELEPERGGWVPVTDSVGLTSVAGVYAAGSCCGIGGDSVSDGARVGAAAARAAAGLAPETPPAARPRATLAPQRSALARAQVWLRAQLAASGLDVNVCLCEEVTRRELIGLAPPRYLGVAAGVPGRHDLASLAADGAPNQDQVKRLTRAGMGPCQGRRCREQVHALIAQACNVPLSSVPLARYRAPLRPLPLAVLGGAPESPALREAWVAWFNIATQWQPHWEPQPVPLPATAAAPHFEAGE